jgi:hypothetical protein
MILTFEQIQNIVKTNPSKSIIDKGKATADKLMMHLHGMNVDIKHSEYFASQEVYNEQKKCAISNKDLFSRLLQQEDMIFMARGGSSYFHLSEEQEVQMNEILSNVRYGMNLRKWIRNIALQAYRSDPAGIIFMEVETLQVDETGAMNDPQTYPTYKSIYSIFDYLTDGRTLQYVVFRLKAIEALAYGIQDEKLKGLKADADTDYYRIVDDIKDLIVKRDGDNVILVTNISQKNPLPNNWNKVPGFIISDLFRFYNASEFVSPVDFVVELADCFLYDRSVRDLQKKYHGFSKAIEPLLQCPTCVGTGFVSASPCPSCTPMGADKGTGYKLKTKVSDVAKFPLEVLENSNFDWQKLFGYATPDIKGWEKQDQSLDDLEELMEMTYWGTIRMKRPQLGPDQPITATESNSNDAPKEARLNMTADWAETTENMIADFIGQYWFESAWKKASISYGRDYILKNADDYKDVYEELRTKGAPDSALDNAFRKWKRAEYMNNPVKQTIELKKFDVEPFPHIGVVQAKAIVTDFNDYNAKLYFGEWSNTIPEAVWLNKTPQQLRELLKQYVLAKGIKEPAPAQPILN